MRYIILATAVVLAVGVAIPTPSFAAQKKSLSDSFNACVSLARERGYSNSDLDGNRAAARNFVISCMQGKASRAQRR